MPGLLIKEFPEHLHKKLKLRAAENHRSMMKEALYLLEVALEDDNMLQKKLPAPIQGAFLLTDAWIEQAKIEGRS
jgi:plasmid stability protein